MLFRLSHGQTIINRCHRFLQGFHQHCSASRAVKHQLIFIGLHLRGLLLYLVYATNRLGSLRILSVLKLGKQVPQYKAAAKVLDQFIKELEV